MFNPFIYTWGWVVAHQSTVSAVTFFTLFAVWAIHMMWDAETLRKQNRALFAYIQDTRNITAKYARQVNVWVKREAEGNGMGQELIAKLESANQIIEIQTGKLKQGLQARMDSKFDDMLAECKDTINRMTADIHGEMKQECFAIVEQEVKKNLPPPTVKKRDRKNKRNTTAEKTVL